MESPIVSIDVSNGNSHYMCFIKNNKRFGKVKKIDHDIEGFKRLLEDIQKLEAETNEKVCAVFEATGVYTKPSFIFKNSLNSFFIFSLNIFFSYFFKFMQTHPKHYLFSYLLLVS